MKKLLTILSSAAFVLIIAAKSAAAQETAVYVDAQEKEFYTARQAEMMKYRNENGKKLKKVKVAPGDYAQTDDMAKMYVDEVEKEFYTPAEAKKNELQKRIGRGFDANVGNSRRLSADRRFEKEKEKIIFFSIRTAAH